MVRPGCAAGSPHGRGAAENGESTIMMLEASTHRAERAAGTKEAILLAAERLFAERGVFAVSNRQVSEAAGQANNTAVGYHFGSKTDLVRAIVDKHSVSIDRERARLIEAHSGSNQIRDWVSCLVRPLTAHLGAQNGPTWFARFGSQLMTDPELRNIMSDQAMESPALRATLDGLNSCLVDLPIEVRVARSDMALLLTVHTCAERERVLAEGIPNPADSWNDCGSALIDAITGLWLAPVTP